MFVVRVAQELLRNAKPDHVTSMQWFYRGGEGNSFPTQQEVADILFPAISTDVFVREWPDLPGHPKSSVSSQDYEETFELRYDVVSILLPMFYSLTTLLSFMCGT